MNVYAQQPASAINRPGSRAEMALVGVYEISKVLASPNRLEVTLSGVLSLLSSFLDMGHGLIALLDAQGDPEMVVGSGWSESNAKHYFNLLPERAVGQIVATKMPLVVPNVLTSPLFAGVDLQGWGPEGGVAFSLVGVPIKDGEQVVGTLTIDRPIDDSTQIRFDEDVRFLTMVANLVGQTLRMHKVVTRDRERLMSEQARREKEHASISHYAGGDDVVRPSGANEKCHVGGIVSNSPMVLAVIERIKEKLAEVKADPDLKRIPVVILTTSKAEEDILKTYNLHANCFITKPIDLHQFIKVVQAIEEFWFTIVKLPPI